MGSFVSGKQVTIPECLLSSRANHEGKSTKLEDERTPEGIREAEMGVTQVS